MADTLDWPPRRQRRVGRWILLGALVLLLLSGGTTLSYYVEALWYESLGYANVFWRTLELRSTIFSGFFGATFFVLYLSYLALKPARLGEIAGGAILINGRPLRLPVEPVLKLIAVVVSLAIAAATGAGMMAEWPTLALYWHAPTGAEAAAAGPADPVFGRPLAFYLFTLPAWELVAGWLLTLAVVVCAIAGFFVVIAGGSRMLTRRGWDDGRAGRGLSLAFAGLLLVLAFRVYLGRFERLLEDHAIFAGVTYTDAHVTLAGLLIVSVALVLGAAIAAINAVSRPRILWLVASVIPAAACYVIVSVLGWYMTSFIVKPNELVREQPYIAHNIEMTRMAFALNRIDQRPFPAEAGLEAVDPAANRATLDNIRLWDWRALQDTLRQIQEIRTYYDFPDIDIDRYEVGGGLRQMMLAARELNVAKLPTSSRNWINEKLIYTHGYGVTMNPVNGFTPEGLPQLVLSNMPVQSAIPGFGVTRPEIYFGEQTETDVYVKTRQKEFNYPQGETNNLTTYEGRGGIVLSGFFRKLFIAIDRGDLTKLPFSDDITSDSRLLMRRRVRERVETLAPYLIFDRDPYIVVTEDGRLVWILDGFTMSESYPYARHYPLRSERDAERVNYVRNSVKAVVDAYDGTVSFYVFDAGDPIIAGYHRIFPGLYQDASAMPSGLRKHVRYPELLLRLQAEVYGLYHMTDPEVFFNREDLWTVATEIGLTDQGRQGTKDVEANFVLMRLPGERDVEFVEILPFTPARRNNLIGWIAGRCDEPHYGTAIVYDFPKTKLVVGPQQVEARIDQNSQLSGQLTLWNQQGSHVLRGALLVIPIGRALLYAEPIYLQAERSPMPELRLVVLALQDRLAYGPTFEAAMAGLFGAGASTLPGGASSAPGTAAATISGAAAPAAPGGAATATSRPQGAVSPESAADRDSLIASAARDLAEYQRLTAEGRLGEAGQKLEALKRALEELQRK